MKRIYRKTKKALFVFICIVQKILVVFFLTLVYIFIFGITYMFMFLFCRKKLSLASLQSRSSWQKAKGYGVNTHNIFRQS